MTQPGFRCTWRPNVNVGPTLTKAQTTLPSPTMLRLPMTAVGWISVANRAPACESLMRCRGGLPGTHPDRDRGIRVGEVLQGPEETARPGRGDAQVDVTGRVVDEPDDLPDGLTGGRVDRPRRHRESRDQTRRRLTITSRSAIALLPCPVNSGIVTPPVSLMPSRRSTLPTVRGRIAGRARNERVDVLDVLGELLVPGERVAAADLGQAGDARAAPRGGAPARGVAVEVVHEQRARTDQAHVAAQRRSTASAARRGWWSAGTARTASAARASVDQAALGIRLDASSGT